MKRDIKKIKTSIIPILKSYGVKKAAIFGSYATGIQKKQSDVDILIDLNKDIGLLDFVGIKLELEKVLRKKVDLIEYNTIKPLIKKNIMNTQIRIL